MHTISSLLPLWKQHGSYKFQIYNEIHQEEQRTDRSISGNWK